MVLSSIVIVQWQRGYVAHVRYDDPKADADISATSKWTLYDLIERHIRKVGT